MKHLLLAVALLSAAPCALARLHAAAEPDEQPVLPPAAPLAAQPAAGAAPADAAVADAAVADAAVATHSAVDKCLYASCQEATRVRVFAQNGAYLGQLGSATAGVAALHGPYAMQWGSLSNKLYVANGNVGVQCVSGSVLRFTPGTGGLDRVVVPPAFLPEESCINYLGGLLRTSGANGACNATFMAATNDTAKALVLPRMDTFDVAWPAAPYQVNDIIVLEATNQLVVADYTGSPDKPGKLQMYGLDHRTGTAQWLFDFAVDSTIFPHQFNPRGIAMHPSDGNTLYVTARAMSKDPLSPLNLVGWVLRFGIRQRRLLDVFVDADNCNGCKLHRPDGLAFDANGILYVTSFMNNSQVGVDNDRIIAFDRRGNYLPGRTIELWDGTKGLAVRQYCQGITFDAAGNMYTAMIASNVSISGDVRRYNGPTLRRGMAHTKFASGDALGQHGGIAPWDMLWAPCPGPGAITP